jgi:L-threonylcarbamoyladenylate synthase
MQPCSHAIVPRAHIALTDTPQSFRAAVKQAAELLRKGEVVALPTETVYGLAANALDERAVSKIFDLKGRPSHNPIIVHVASIEMAQTCVEHWPLLASKLADAFWPGPLTLVLPRSTPIPDIVVSGGRTVGLRWPSHPFIHAVIQECNFPLAAPSANLANEISPTNIEHVRKSFEDRISLIVDGGQCQVGIESTVLDLTDTPPRVLRPGMIHDQSLLAVTGKLKCSAGSEDTMVRKSPGMLQKHYSPRAKLILCSWTDDQGLLRQLTKLGPLEKIHIVAHTHIPSGEPFGRVSVIPHDPEAFARAIYAELHECDRAGAEVIVIESIPNGGEWRGIEDRLKRASAES